MAFRICLYHEGDFDGNTEKCVRDGIADIVSARAVAIRILKDTPTDPKTGNMYEAGILDGEGFICGYVRQIKGGFTWFNWRGGGTGSHHLNADGTTVKRKRRKDAKTLPFGL